MPVIPAGFGQANIRFEGAAAPTGAELTLGFQQLGAGSPSDVATIISALVVTDIMPVLSDDLIHTGVLVKFGPTATGPSAFVANNTAGSVTGDADVANVSILVRKNTALGGRAGSGRWFVPGASQDLFQENSRMTVGDDLVYDGIWEDFRTGLIAADIVPVVLHSVGSPVNTPTPITEFKTDPLAATQRRRLRR
jgi:hypothetical protein